MKEQTGINVPRPGSNDLYHYSLFHTEFSRRIPFSSESFRIEKISGQSKKLPNNMTSI